MSGIGISRRRLIQTTAGVAVILAAVKGGQILLTANLSKGDGSSSDSVVQLEVHEGDTLRQVVRRLFPYEGLGEEPYTLVVDTVQSVAEVAQLLAEGVASLDAAAESGNWLELSEQQQVVALKGIESGSFFQLMLTTSIHSLHTNKELWKLIGYQGTSVELGGYINRGFNDIDWLPL